MSQDPFPPRPQQAASQPARPCEGIEPPQTGSAPGVPSAAMAATTGRKFVCPPGLPPHAAAAPLWSAGELRRDIELARRLAQMRPSGEMAARVRERLAAHIQALVPAARAAAEAMPCDDRARDVALSAVHQATALARHPEQGDQGAMLTLLATNATFLWRYAAADTPASGARPASSSAPRSS